VTFVSYPYYREKKKERSWFWTLLEIIITVMLGILLYVFVMDFAKHLEIPASPFFLLLFKVIFYLTA